MKSPKRKICVVTGSRAEYGLLFWLLKEIDADPELELQLVVTGSHLSSEFGKTESYILKDGFKISYRVDALIANDSIVATTKSTGIGIIGFADCFANLAPDVLLVLGDRFEVFSAVVAAMIARVPIAHLHGGETTEGVIDEAIRHSISKMSHLHFVAAEAYGRRLGQMGEEFSSIFVVGAMGLEWLHRNPVLLSKLELEAITGLPFAKKNILVVFHPESLSGQHGLNTLTEMMSALRGISANLYISASNADTGGRQITDALRQFVSEDLGHRVIFSSLGHKNFLSLMKVVDLIVGNSSSGIIEAPAIGTPTLNIGCRQDGRLKASSVTDCEGKSDVILHQIHQVLSANTSFGYVPYGRGGPIAGEIVSVLKRANLEHILVKRFVDRNQ